MRTIVLAIGFNAVVAQCVLLREFLVVFQGNEISLGLALAAWLVWTALGTALFGRVASRVGQPRRLLAVMNGLAALALPATIAAIRANRTVFESGAVFGVSLAALGLFCVISGGLFPAASRAWQAEAGASPEKATGAVYLLEAAGAAGGGLLASFVLLERLDPFQIGLLLSVLYLAASLRRGAYIVLAAGVPLALITGARVEAISAARLWRGFNIDATANSLYGSLAVVETEGSRTLYENGLALFTWPDPAAAEESVHYALLNHPAPKSLLLIGGGWNGAIAEALKHPSLQRVDVVELDPAIVELARRWFPKIDDRRVQVHETDGRLFVRTTAERFDAIVVNVPDPQTAQLNRFYTLEFYREAAGRLNAGGVLSLRLSGAENFLSKELAALLMSIHATLRAVFPEVAFLPGQTVHFFAARRAGVLASGAGGLLARLRERGLKTDYVREYYLPFRMMPERMRQFEAQIRPRADTPLNRDFTPVAYYFDVALWSGRFGHGWRVALETLAHIPFAAVASAGLAALVLAAGLLRTRRAAAGLSTIVMGFTLIGLEILLLLGFQAVHGYVYHQLAVVIAAFMAGMAIGSYRALRGNRTSLCAVQLAAAAAPLLLFAAIRAPAPLFPAMALACGYLGGYQFPVASRVFFAGAKNGDPGALYALDLAGACIGAAAISGYLVPVFGFWKTALLISAANLPPAARALRTQRQ